MRLEGLKIRNLGPFVDFEVDLDDYRDARVIAVTGPIGTGKSTMLERALPGAMFRDTPTRGSLMDLATARDSMIEARVVNGKPWKIRHTMDKVSGKGESVVLDANNVPQFDSAKVSAFDAWAAKNLPSQEVFFSSVFAPQGASGFLGMKPGARKEVLLRVLGVERLEKLAERARKRANDAKAKLDTAVARIADENARSVGVAAAELGVIEAKQTHQVATTAASAATGAYCSAWLAHGGRVHSRSRMKKKLRTTTVTQVIPAITANVQRSVSPLMARDAKCAFQARYSPTRRQQSPGRCSASGAGHRRPRPQRRR